MWDQPKFHQRRSDRDEEVRKVGNWPRWLLLHRFELAASGIWETEPVRRGRTRRLRLRTTDSAGLPDDHRLRKKLRRARHAVLGAHHPSSGESVRHGGGDDDEPVSDQGADAQIAGGRVEFSMAVFACYDVTHRPMQATTRTAGRSLGRNVTLRSSMKPIAPPGLSA